MTTTILPKTCPRCLGTGSILINAGTGLLASCPACNPPTAPIKPQLK